MESIGRRLGQHLRALRISRKLNMRQAAALAGITQGYLSQIENGIYVPSARTVTRLARAYGIAEVELLLSAGIIKELMLSTSDGDLEPLSSASLASAERALGRMLELTREELSPLSDERLVPLFDCSGKCLHNAKGMPTGIRLPFHFCGYDETAFLIEADSDELSPLVFSGDWVVISPSATISPDEVAALHNGERFFLRKYTRLGGMIGFHASATQFPSWTMEHLTEHGITIIGRALRVVSRELNSRRVDPNSSP